MAAQENTPNSKNKESKLGKRFTILWHYGDYNRFDTDDEKEARDKWTQVEANSLVTRIMIKDDICVASWFGTDPWKDNIYNFARKEGLNIKEYIVLWHWDNKWQLKYFTTINEAINFYSKLNVFATKIISHHGIIDKSWYGDIDWKKKIYLKLLELTPL